MGLLDGLYLAIARHRGCFTCGSRRIVLAVRDDGELKGACWSCLLEHNGPHRALWRSSWHWSSEPLLRGPVVRKNLDSSKFAKKMRAALRAAHGEYGA